ncbi:MAG: hypothetical protein HYZ62_01190 [Candidatus Andersenbacteria bacterium]|nr:hypothetical protein [Candidatus Andersenbacteria bacterium]
MVFYTKKWWLLGCHARAERKHSTNGSHDGSMVFISKDFFMNGRGEYNGLMHKYNPYVRFRPSHLIFWKKEFSDERLKINKYVYNEIYKVCLEHGYITVEKGDDGNNYPTVSNAKAYGIRGFPLGYFQGLGKNYDKVWFAIGAILVALIGSSMVANVFSKKVTLPPTPIVNNITIPDIPDVNPIINVYPTNNVRPTK